MLYEVITVSGSPTSDNLYFDDDTLIDFDYNKYVDTVITSYSIHYTKLYERRCDN